MTATKGLVDRLVHHSAHHAARGGHGGVDAGAQTVVEDRGRVEMGQEACEWRVSGCESRWGLGILRVLLPTNPATSPEARQSHMRDCDSRALPGAVHHPAVGVEGPRAAALAAH